MESHDGDKLLKYASVSVLGVRRDDEPTVCNEEADTKGGIHL